MANLSSNLYMRLFQKDPPQEFIEKRRKLSVLSHSTDSLSGDLNEKFNKLEINQEQKFLDNLTLSNGSQSSASPPHFIHIPKPIKVSPRVPYHIPSQERENMDHQNFNPMKSLMLEQLGICKYLILDREQEASEVLKQPQAVLERIQKKMNEEKPFQKPYKNKLIYPFGVPANFEFLIKQSENILKSQIIQRDLKLKEQIQSVQLQKSCPKLTLTQRAEKVRIYLEKKQKRQWDAVKYMARKKLADQRKRENGKFVKQPKKLFFTQSQSEISLTESRLTASWEGHSDSKELKDLRKLQSSILRNSQD